MRLIRFIAFLCETQYKTQVSFFFLLLIAVTNSNVYFPDYKSSWDTSGILNNGKSCRHRWIISELRGFFPIMYVGLLLAYSIDMCIYMTQSFIYVHIYVYINAHTCMYICAFVQMYAYASLKLT